MKKMTVVMVLLLVVAQVLAACATPTPAPTQAPAAQPTAAPAKPTAAPAQPTAAPVAGGRFTIGISNPFISSEYRTQMIQELKDVNAEYMAADVTNDLVIESADTDVAGQIQQLQNLMSKNVDAILVNPGDVVAWVNGARLTEYAIVTTINAGTNQVTVRPAFSTADPPIFVATR